MKKAISVKRPSVPEKSLYISKLRAFTLVELMFVLAIVFILVSVAFPSYLAINQKTQRTEGQALLIEIQSQLERHYFYHQQYPESLSKLRHYHADDIDSEHSYYQVTLKFEESCPSDACFLLIAKHKSGQEKETLSLYSSGERQGPW